MPNLNRNSNPQEENSGVSINLRLPGRAIATTLSIIVAFGGGMSISAVQNNRNQNNVDCSIRNSPVPIQQPLAK